MRDLWNAIAAMLDYGNRRVDEECFWTGAHPGEFNITLSEWMGWRE